VVSRARVADDHQTATDVGVPLTGCRRKGRGFQGVQNGEVSLAVSLASSESSLLANSSRSGRHRHGWREQRRGKGESRPGRLGLGQGHSAGPARARRRDREGEEAARPRPQLGRHRRLDRAETKKVKEVFSFSIF
jgi:hypothetical protein